LMGLEGALRRHTDTTIREILDSVGEEADGSSGLQVVYGAGGFESDVRTVGGVVTSLSPRYTKRGELMATFVLEDLEAAIEVFVFPKTMSNFGTLLETDAIVCLRARLDLRDDQPKLITMEVSRPELVPVSGDEPLEVKLPVPVLTEDVVGRFKELLLEHHGTSPVRLTVGSKRLRLPPEFNVDRSNGLVGALKELLGAGAVIV
jgi:DNA polymerase III subunit alpha